jgi:transcriptional regulator with XRE-family HTH domain
VWLNSQQKGGIMTELELIKSFSQNLKVVLDYSWMSQKELAEETGLSDACISYYMNGKCLPTVKNLINIADALDCELSDLIDTIEHID